MKRAILADENSLFSEGLSLILEKEEDFAVSSTFASAKELVELVERKQPDLLILNQGLLNPVDLKEIKLCSQETKILVLSDQTKLLDLEVLLASGADGLLSKSANKNELHFALSSLLKGQTYLSPSICKEALEKKEKRHSRLEKLSKREIEVLKLLAQGLKNNAVAKLLHISARTIDSHRAHIMQKLEIQSNAEMIRIALEEGLIAG